MNRRSALLASIGIATAGAMIAAPTAAGAATVNELGFLDVTDYGAVGDNTALCSDAFDAAMAAAVEGSVIYIPAGIYRLSRPIKMKRNVTLLGSAAPGRWSYKSGAPSRIKVDTGTWSGDALVVFEDKEVSGATDELEGCSIRNLAIDGVAFNNPACDGIRALGHVQDIQLENVSIWNVKGNGIYVNSSVRSDGSTGLVSGWRLEKVSVCQASTGFCFGALTDSNLTDCLAVSCSGSGYYLVDGSDNHFDSCRAVFNGGAGFRVNGDNGSLQFSNCSTDRNGNDGWYLTCNDGPQAIILNGCYARRDGAAGGDYSGLRIYKANHCPVIINGFATHVSKGDDGSDPASPAYGIRAQSTGRFISLNGVSLMGVKAGLYDQGGSVTKSGYVSSTVASTGLAVTWGTPH